MAADTKQSAPTFIRESTMKEYLSSKKLGDIAGFRSKGELAEALNAQVAVLLDHAAQRCAANGRSTVGPDDL